MIEGRALHIETIGLRGVQLQVYVLEDGRRVVAGDSLEAFVEALRFSGLPLELGESACEFVGWIRTGSGVAPEAQQRLCSQESEQGVSP